MKPSELQPFLVAAMKNQFPVLLTGAPGAGKTDIITSAARDAGSDLIVMHPSVSDPTDFKGMPGIIEGAAEFLPYGDLRRLIDADCPTVAFADDLGQAPNSVQAAYMQLLLARRIGEHKVSDHVTFVAATNRREDKAGVSGLLEPVKSRFASIVAMDVDLDDWCLWALSNNMPVELVYFIRYRPALLMDPKPTHELTNTPSPRTVTNVGKWLNAGVSSLEVLGGAAGEGFAAEFLAFFKVFNSLPNPDAILLNPESADVPTDTSVLYALCGSLAGRATPTVADNLFTYIKRLPAEFQAFLVKDILRMNEAIAGTRAFILWSSSEQNILFGH